MYTEDLIFYVVLIFFVSSIFWGIVFWWFRRRANRRLRNKYDEELNKLQEERDAALANNNVRQISKNNDLILERHYVQYLNKNKATTIATIIVGVTGFIFLLLFIYVIVSKLHFENLIDNTLGMIVTAISGISGAITSFISIVFLNTLIKTEKKIDNNLDKLRNEGLIQTQYALIEEIKDKEEKQKMINSLIGAIRKQMTIK